MRLIGLDIETSPHSGHPEEYALQPWRAREGKALITDASLVESRDSCVTLDLRQAPVQSLIDALERDRTAYYVTWNGVFDVAWMYASGVPVERYRWLDGMLLWKWLENGQRQELAPDWSLDAASVKWLKDEPWAVKYHELKTNPQPLTDRSYWTLRNQLDTLATVMIARKLMHLIDPIQRNQVLIEAACIVPVAKSWVNGIKFDVQGAAAMAPAVTAEMRQIEAQLNLITPPTNRKQDRERTINGWVPSKILSSPKQLAELLYEKWRLPCSMRSETTDAPATHKTALTYLSDIDQRVLDILRWRKLNTQYTKFIKGIAKSAEYLGSDVLHPGPKLFSTYTGRMTYASKSGQKGPAAKAKIGVAVHQWPREKEMRKLLVAPEGKIIWEPDASSQEVRWMAVKSGDPTMVKVFRDKLDPHSLLGSRISGIDYDEFIRRKKAEDEVIVGPRGLRMAGKVTGLSNLYRIGTKKMRFTARVDYGLDIDLSTAAFWQNTFHSTYPGIKDYWARAIASGLANGYAQTQGGRRFKLEFWDDDSRWGTESSSINCPIQGSGADQKELAIAILHKKFPELQFFLDLHDGLFYLADDEPQSLDLFREAKYTLDNLPYQEAWGFDTPVPFPWDDEVGYKWGEMKEVK